MGVSVDVSIAAVDTATVVIAQVNKQMLRTQGDGLIHISRFDAYCEVDEALPELHHMSLQKQKLLKTAFYNHQR